LARIFALFASRSWARADAGGGWGFGWRGGGGGLLAAGCEKVKGLRWAICFVVCVALVQCFELWRGAGAVL
jgi:hypothetical protein